MKQFEFAKTIAELAELDQPFAVATVVKTEGSTLGKPGFKTVISKNGDVLYGSLGGVCPESAIVATAKQTMATGQAKTVKVFLEDVERAVEGVVTSKSDDEIHVETNCGGVMEVYVEPFLPQQRLILVGQGGKDDVEDVLVKIGKILEFEVVVIDHSPVLSEEPDQLIKDPMFEIGKFKFKEGDSVVVLTKGARDVEILAALSRFKLKYVGILASKQRIQDDLSELRKMGIGEDFIASIRAPIGADIGSVTPPEIALSILAEVVATRHGKSLPRKSLGSEKQVSVKHS
jgi:xanthine dehydrogenase accessory factor